MDTELWPCVNREKVFTQPIYFAPNLKKSTKVGPKMKFDFVASSLNGAYEQLAKHGLAPVTKEFHILSEGPRMEVVHGENHVRLDWGLIQLAAQRPRGALLEGENSQHKSLVGPEPSSELKPSSILPGATKGFLVNSCKPRRKKRMTSAKARQFSDRRLFKGGCQDKKKKKRGKRGKKGKVVEGKPVASFSTNYKEWQRRDADIRSQGQVASDANRDFDLNAKVGLGDEYVFFCICKLSFYLR